MMRNTTMMPSGLNKAMFATDSDRLAAMSDCTVASSLALLTGMSQDEATGFGSTFGFTLRGLKAGLCSLHPSNKAFGNLRNIIDFVNADRCAKPGSSFNSVHIEKKDDLARHLQKVYQGKPFALMSVVYINDNCSHLFTESFNPVQVEDTDATAATISERIRFIAADKVFIALNPSVEGYPYPIDTKNIVSRFNKLLGGNKCEADIRFCICSCPNYYYTLHKPFNRDLGHAIDLLSSITGMSEVKAAEVIARCSLHYLKHLDESAFRTMGFTPDVLDKVIALYQVLKAAYIVPGLKKLFFHFEEHAFLRNIYFGKNREFITLVYLNSQYEVVHVESLAECEATHSDCCYYTDYVMSRVKDYKASHIIEVHNHPSGNSVASSDDILHSKEVSDELSKRGFNSISFCVFTDEDIYSYYPTVHMVQKAQAYNENINLEQSVRNDIDVLANIS